MIDLLIFSRDRAMQLEALLNSIQWYGEGVFNISVVWTYSEPSYGEAYQIIKEQYPEINWVWKENPKNLTNIPFEHMKSCWISLSSDDNIWYRELPCTPEELNDILPRHNDEVFSFRLGYNTIEQDIHRGTKQPPLNLHTNKNGVLRWNPHMYSPSDNYGYPLAVDFHVFRADFLLPLLKRCKFSRPNELEGYLQHSRNDINELSSFQESCTVNIPTNNMSQLTLVNDKGFTLSFLNDEFLKGKRISIEDVSRYPVRGCHQPIHFVLK